MVSYVILVIGIYDKYQLICFQYTDIHNSYATLTQTDLV